MKKSLLLLTSSFSTIHAFHLPLTASSPRTNLCALEEKKGDNKAMSFLRKMGRVGGSANMDFANAMGLDESPSGGTKSSYHEDGFKVSTCFVIAETGYELFFLRVRCTQCFERQNATHKNRMYENQKQPTYPAQPPEL